MTFSSPAHLPPLRSLLIGLYSILLLNGAKLAIKRHDTVRSNCFFTAAANHKLILNATVMSRFLPLQERGSRNASVKLPDEVSAVQRICFNVKSVD